MEVKCLVMYSIFQNHNFSYEGIFNVITTVLYNITIHYLFLNQHPVMDASQELLTTASSINKKTCLQWYYSMW